MSLKEIVRHSVLGTATFVILERPLHAKIQASTLPEDEKIRYTGAMIGAVGSGILGYIIGEQLSDGKKDYTFKDKVTSIGICSISGGLAGYMIASNLLDNRRDET